LISVETGAYDKCINRRMNSQGGLMKGFK